MKLIRGSDLVGAFSALGRMDEMMRFMSVRSATQHALAHDVTDLEALRLLLRAWVAAADAPRAGDAVDPPEDSNTGTPSTRDVNS